MFKNNYCNSGLLDFLSIMPTKRADDSENNSLVFDYTRSWTDDLPVCKVSGMYKIKTLFIITRNLFLIL